MRVETDITPASENDTEEPLPIIVYDATTRADLTRDIVKLEVEGRKITDTVATAAEGTHPEAGRKLNEEKIHGLSTIAQGEIKNFSDLTNERVKTAAKMRRTGITPVLRGPRTMPGIKW